MRLRCTVPTNVAYPNYGGRGITVCDRWLNDVQAFMEDMGPKPTPKHELDREDNDKGYYPGNCRWATRSENDRNRRSNRWVVFKGRRMVLVEALALAGLSGTAANTVAKRLSSGWSDDKAFSTTIRFKSTKGQRQPKYIHPPMTNATGLKGIKFDKARNRFIGTHMVDGKRTYTKRFRTAEEAHAAYLELVKLNNNGKKNCSG